MASGVSTTPGLASFRRSLSSEPIDKSIEYLIGLLKRRQIRGSKACALATAYLLRRVVSTTRATDPGKLIHRVQNVGRRLAEAAPRELAVGNVVRRVLGAIREEEDTRAEGSPTSSEIGSVPATPAVEMPGSVMSSPQLGRPQLLATATGIERRPQITSMFSIVNHPTMRPAGTSSPLRSGASTPMGFHSTPPTTDFRAEVLEAIHEIVDELDQADEQIAGYALEHISPQETILTYSSSLTVQRFLLKAASKRKFTVIHAESYPNSHRKTHALVTGNKAIGDSDTDPDDTLSSESFSKPLISAGITVLLIPDSAIFALMPRANKVILSAHAVLSNGSILAASGSKPLIRAARFHRVPVIVLAATYKLSPLYPHTPSDLIEYGDVSKVVPYQDRELSQGLWAVRNPIYDFIDGNGDGAADMFVTNLGGCASGYLYRIVRDQYRDEDLEL